uniref:NADH dehydrogenase subunit 6 n=1 Tax=Hetaerina titia TaxID=62019 RepID=UPI002E76F701|nr:NADH dehydrogenase subunit 6 [Hetaerina titia]WPM98313.1 NADH dehydrogenase subunit 6 [Hetaerina titia]
MSQALLMLLNTGNAVVFGRMKHPISMGALLITQTILICMITNNMAPNAWFSYILFLVFLGGLLVLFIYMTSVASNELFQKDLLPLNLIYIILTLIIIVMMMKDPYLLNNVMENYFQFNSKSVDVNATPVSSMLNPPYNLITMLAVLYLFLTLIVVVKITEYLQGPLRSKN